MLGLVNKNQHSQGMALCSIISNKYILCALWGLVEQPHLVPMTISIFITFVKCLLSDHYLQSLESGMGEQENECTILKWWLSFDPKLLTYKET